MSEKQAAQELLPQFLHLFREAIMYYDTKLCYCINVDLNNMSFKPLLNDPDVIKELIKLTEDLYKDYEFVEMTNVDLNGLPFKRRKFIYFKKKQIHRSRPRPRPRPIYSPILTFAGCLC